MRERERTRRAVNERERERERGEQWMRERDQRGEQLMREKTCHLEKVKWEKWNASSFSDQLLCCHLLDTSQTRSTFYPGWLIELRFLLWTKWTPKTKSSSITIFSRRLRRRSPQEKENVLLSRRLLGEPDRGQGWVSRQNTLEGIWRRTR